jgi:hypothetical protein
MIIGKNVGKSGHDVIEVLSGILSEGAEQDENPSMIVSDSAEIRTEHLPNKSHEGFLFGSLSINLITIYQAFHLVNPSLLRIYVTRIMFFLYNVPSHAL